MRQALLPLALFAVLGCGEQGPTKYRLSGKVSFDGTPLKEGAVLFEGRDGTPGKEMAVIRNGTYDIRLPPGSWLVRITSSRTVPGKKDAMGLPLVEQFIPKHFNDASDFAHLRHRKQNGKFRPEKLLTPNAGGRGSGVLEFQRLPTSLASALRTAGSCRTRTSRCRFLVPRSKAGLFQLR